MGKFYNKHKFLIDNITTVCLEVGGVLIVVSTLPEDLTVLAIVGGVLSVDNAFKSASALFERYALRESEKESQGVDIIKGAFGYTGEKFGELTGQDPKYTKSCAETLYDETSSTITVINAGSACKSLLESPFAISKLETQTSKANEALNAAKNVEKSHLTDTAQKFDNVYNKSQKIDTLQQKIDQIKNSKSSMSKGEYKYKLNQTKTNLENAQSSLPSLINNWEKSQEQLFDLQSKTIEAEGNYKINFAKLCKEKSNVKPNAYFTATAPILFNTEGTYDSFHFNYFSK